LFHYLLYLPPAITSFWRNKSFRKASDLVLFVFFYNM
jgi:hypothetical protein